MLAAPLSLCPDFEGQKEQNGEILQPTDTSVHHSGCVHTMTQRPDSSLSDTPTDLACEPGAMGRKEQQGWAHPSARSTHPSGTWPCGGP